MTEKSEASTSTSHEFWELSEAAAQLTNHACTISARHLRDGMTRSLFNRELPITRAVLLARSSKEKKRLQKD